ncbi:restriction endonuclease subunit S [Zunongwangia sp. F363]|uniref:Restriction endonuclease subunit S n=1 Tax=Autumnicola tepida TaxID=3075595 RepID=A0ABU3C5J3_9FLAO|nr:restriction endonuclease subunit S [Zunongwangia sp. F363]MDT0641615.1 restriction endonuclease subunit S [Zunongwangia sp. F363]
MKSLDINILPDTWDVRKLSEITTAKNSSISMGEIEGGSGSFPIYGASGIITTINTYASDEEYVGIIKDGAGVGRVLKCEPKSSLLGTLTYIFPSGNCDIDYLFYSLQAVHFNKFIIGSTIPHIYYRDYSMVKIPFPPIKEQREIAIVLVTIDRAISKSSSLLLLSEKRKTGLKQQLLTGRKRFKEFVKSKKSLKTKLGDLPEDWELKHISDIVHRVKKRFTPDLETPYREIGIRSHCKGIFHKEEVSGASLGNKSVFWIQPDCFVVNIVFAWEHAIAKTTEAEVGMIASHRFPMYKPKKEILDLDYLLYFFKTARGKHLLGLASPGGAGRNKTLGQSEFAKLKIPVPSLEEQKKIVAVLSEADKEIELLQQQIDVLKEQKKGLMQKLLTGEVRVKID